MGGGTSRPRRSATTRPRQNATGGPHHEVAKAPEPWRVAAFGDSLMWGQGLNRTDRFTSLITGALRAVLGQGRGGMVSADASRSGAQIRARADQRTQFPDQRTQFLDTFPSLFHGGRQRRRFLDGTDESFATGLYGEIPAPFPTVRGQVDLVSDAVGKTIDIALVDGGINDIAPEDIINPAVSGGEFIEEWDGLIRAVGHDDVLELIGRVRRTCPGAVIMYFGFFAPLSYSSSPNQIRALFKHELNEGVRDASVMRGPGGASGRGRSARQRHGRRPGPGTATLASGAAPRRWRDGRSTAPPAPAAPPAPGCRLAGRR
jgi:hypothetical protein